MGKKMNEESNKIDLRWAKKMFYKLLDDPSYKKQTLDILANIKTKNKVLRGYVHGVLAITSNKKRKYAYNANDPITNKKLLKILSKMGDNRFLPDFDKGVFLAWKDYLIYIKNKENSGIDD